MLRINLVLLVLLTAVMPAMASEYRVSYTMHRVVQVEELYDRVIERTPHSTSQLICERENNVGDVIVGGIVGGLIGNSLSRGRGRVLGTVLGSGSGMYVGSRVSPSNNCRRVYITDGFIEREREIFIGYSVLLDDGDRFTTTERYQIGDRVRKKITRD